MTASCDPVCETCDGFGICPDCRAGWLPRVPRFTSGDEDDIGDACDSCAATGRCPDCNGTGEPA